MCTPKLQGENVCSARYQFFEFTYRSDEQRIVEDNMLDAMQVPLQAATMLAEGGRRLAAGDYMYCVNIRNWVIIMSSMIGGHAGEIAVSL